MIETVRRAIPQVVTVAAVNAQIALLNTAYSSSVQALPAGAIFHAWAQEVLSLPRPSIAYYVGWNRDGVAQLQRNGKNRMDLPVWFYLIAPANLPDDSSYQHLGVLFEALMYVMDAFPPNGMEQVTISGPTLTHVVALVSDPTIRSFTVDAQGGGQIPGIASMWTFTVDTARS